MPAVGSGRSAQGAALMTLAAILQMQDALRDFNDRLIRFMTEQSGQAAPHKIKPVDRERREEP